VALQAGVRGQALLRGQITLAGDSSASPTQAILSTPPTARIALAALAGTAAVPLRHRQA